MQQNSEDQEIVIHYSYKDVPTVRAFSQDNHFLRGLMGPFGCVAERTRVVTARGLVPIAELKPGELVLSFDERSNQFRLYPCAGGYPKGKDCLYRIATQRGGFVAAGHHHVFCEGNVYRSVESLYRDQHDDRCLPSRILTTCADHMQYFSDASHLSHTPSSFDTNCARSSRPCGQLLQSEVSIDPSVPPQQGDAKEQFGYSCQAATLPI